jgi:hypothetical protein
MTRNARRAVLVASLAVAAMAVASAQHAGRLADRTTSADASERYAAFDGGPVRVRKLYEPVPSIVIIGLPREYGNAFGTDTAA